MYKGIKKKTIYKFTALCICFCLCIECLVSPIFTKANNSADSKNKLIINAGESYRITASANTRLGWTGDAVFESAKLNMFMGESSHIAGCSYLKYSAWTSLDKGTVYEVTVKEGSMVYDIDENLTAEKINHDAVVKICLNKGQSCTFENANNDSFTVYFNQYNSSIRRRYYKKNGKQSAEYIDDKLNTSFGSWTVVEGGGSLADKKLIVDALEGTTVLYLAYEDYINNVVSATREMIQGGEIVYDSFSLLTNEIELREDEQYQINVISNIDGYIPSLSYSCSNNDVSVTKEGLITAKSLGEAIITIKDKSGCVKYFTVRGAGTHKNGDITVQTPLRGSITDYQLFKEYPEYLYQSPQESLMERICDDCSVVNDNRTNSENILAAWKYMLEDGNTFKASVKWFSNKLLGTTSISDEYLDGATLELLKEVCSSPEYIEQSVKNVKSKYEWLSDLKNGIKGSNKAQVILALSNNSLLEKSKTKSIIKELEEEWSNIDLIFKTAGYTIDFFDAVTYITIMESIPVDIVENLLSQVKNVDSDSELCRGLERIRKKLKQPGQTVVQNYIKSNIFKNIADEMKKGVENGITTLVDYAWSGTDGAGLIAIANIVCTLISKIMPGASADSIINAQLHMNFFSQLNHVLNRKHFELIANKQNDGDLDIKSEIAKYKLLYNIRLVAAKKACIAGQKIAKGHMKNVLGNNEELVKTFSYKEHIAGCKAKVNAVLDAKYTYKKSGDELAASGVVTEKSVAPSKRNKARILEKKDMDKNEETSDETKDDIFKIPTFVEGKAVTSISDGAFQGNKNIEVLIVPDSVKEIGKDAFRNCTSLKRIFLGSSVTSIGDNAFAGCSSLTYVELAGNVKNIGKNAFDNKEAVIVSPPNVFVEEFTKAHGISFETISKEVEKIEISRYASNLSYKTGEELDETGMELMVTYKDGSKELIDNGWHSIGMTDSIGKTDINVFYGGKKTKYVIEVVQGDVEYEVECIDKGGRQIEYERRKGNYGDKIKITPPRVEGYRCLVESLQLNLDFTVPKAVFVYEEILDKSLSKAIVTLEDNEYKYTGKEVMPKLSVQLGNTILKEGIDYETGFINNKDVGTAFILIYGKGDYSDETATEFSISGNDSHEGVVSTNKKLGIVSGLSMKMSKKNVIISWKNVSGAKGYQLQYSLLKKMKHAKIRMFKKTKGVIKKLKKGKTYYFRVRAYKKDGKQKIYGKWSKVKKIKVKK